ncbi:hypothetical protein RS030_71065 [Cryptosporidium xiaoi]|uniref:Uncharacterized protein n=1 Tax=Cryptosporidium xiaoi TaxID=659607 RepID=A0AAV9XTL4_9CRYT
MIGAIEFIRNNLLVGNPTAIFICFVIAALSVLFPYICFAELTKKKLKKPNRNRKGNNLADNKNKSSENNSLGFQTFPRQANKNKSSFKQMPQLDTESSDDEYEDSNKKDVPIVPSSNYVQGLSYDMDEYDSGGWEIVTEKKSKRNGYEKKTSASGNEETKKNIPKPIDKKPRRKKLINKVPGMTD